MTTKSTVITAILKTLKNLSESNSQNMNIASSSAKGDLPTTSSITMENVRWQSMMNTVPTTKQSKS